MTTAPLPKESPTKNANGTTASPANGSPRKPLSVKKTPTKPLPSKEVAQAPSANGRTPTKATKTPTRTPARSKVSTPANDADEDATPRGSSKRVAASLAAARSTPRKRPRTSAPLPSFDDDVFGTPPSTSRDDSAISSEAFRANERLRRQREARNFTFEGDANSPRTTRSGRVVAPVEEAYGRGDDRDETESKEDVDEYGGMPLEEEETVAEDGFEVDEEAGVRLDVPLSIATSSSPGTVPLPANARPHVLRILSTLTGGDREPAPFDNEEENEALQGLVSLLRGTVERGEGNSALVTGPRGVGKTRTVERALRLLPSGSKTAPIVVRLSGHAQTDDRRAIREMGRQIAEGEGRAAEEEKEGAEAEGDSGDAAYAPTTLPSHLLALLTQPSPRAIIIIIDEFDLFTEHARQALLYCLLDVVQSVQTGPVETTPRGVAVIGMTSRVDTLLLLEKRVKSRFSHRVWRITSPLAAGGPGWRSVLRSALIPWPEKGQLDPDRDTDQWMGDWAFAVDTLLEHDTVSAALERLAGLTTDLRILYRPFVAPVTAVLSRRLDFLSVPGIAASVRSQLELSGWSMGLNHNGVSKPVANGSATPSRHEKDKLGGVDIAAKLRGLPHPALGVVIIAKHLAYAGRYEFSLAQVEDEYARFARSRLVGSGRARWPIALLRRGFYQCRALGLLAPAGPSTVGPRFAKVRAALPPHEVVAFFRGDGGQALGPELAGWGKMSGGHA